MQTPRAFPTLASILFLFFISTNGWAQGRGTGSRGSSTNSNGSNTVARPDATGAPTNVDPVPMNNANDEGKIEFRTQSILVQVPVVITDKAGNHVHGLTKADFHVFENGKEQPVSVFEELTATSGKIAAPASAPGEFRNLTISEDKPRTVTVIALDTVNTPFLDQAVGRRELVKYLANTLDSSQVYALMIISSNGLRIVHGLTGDPNELLEALKKVGSETPATAGLSEDVQGDIGAGGIPDVPKLQPGQSPEIAMEQFVEHGDAVTGAFVQQNAIETTLNGFRGIAWALSGVPGRKSLIWATGGFPFQIYSPNSVPGGYLSTLYERTMEALMQAQISVYPVDVRGLVNGNVMPDARRHPSPYVGQVPTNRQMMNRTWLQDYTTETLDDFAQMTGGKAFYNTNDLATSFKRAAEDASSYYVVGYYLDTHNNHSGWRQLKVKVDKDVEVRARKGFFVTNATIHMDLTRASDISYALTSPIEGTGVPVDVRWSGISGTGATKKAGFVVALPPNGITLEGPNKINFDFAVAAYAVSSKDGKPATEMGKTFAAQVTDAQVATIRSRGVGFNYDLDLAPGQYAVRFVVRDNFTGKMGSVTAPLTVN